MLCSTRCCRVVFVCVFVFACITLSTVSLFYGTAPAASECDLACNYSSPSSHSCLPCVWTNGNATLVSLLTWALGLAFSYSILAVAFTDPGVIEVVEDDDDDDEAAEGDEDDNLLEDDRAVFAAIGAASGGGTDHDGRKYRNKRHRRQRKQRQEAEDEDDAHVEVDSLASVQGTEQQQRPPSPQHDDDDRPAGDNNHNDDDAVELQPVGQNNNNNNHHPRAAIRNQQNETMAITEDTQQQQQQQVLSTIPPHDRFQWETSAGKSRICAWRQEDGKVFYFDHDDNEEQQQTNNNNNNKNNKISSSTSSSTVASMLAREVRPRLKFCTTCCIPRPPRASHCRRCNHCVRTFCHHCVVTDTCVGEGNIRAFRFMLWSATLLACLVLITSSYTFSTIFLKLPARTTKATESSSALAITLMVVSAFATLPLVIMSLFYVRLAVCLGGMTWREYAKRGTAFASHDYATQFDDVCSKLIRTFHCGVGGAWGELAAAACGCCYLFGSGAEDVGPHYGSSSLCCCCGEEKKKVFDVEADEARLVIVPRPCR